MPRSALPLFGIVLALVGCGATDAKECTLRGCHGGTRIGFSMRGAGDYVFEVTVDGEKTTCRATLPLDSQLTSSCDRLGIGLIRSGSALPADAHSLEGLELETTSAKSITIRATRDGELIGESTRTPEYRTSPRPNGPGCPPDGCTSASFAFP